jgi:hypothetical protein
LDQILVTDFCNRICGGLKNWPHYLGYIDNVDRDRQLNSDTMLSRITNAERKISLPPSRYQVEHGDKRGQPITLSCFVCRRYMNQDGKSIRNLTSFWCRQCHMPLCKKIE